MRAQPSSCEQILVVSPSEHLCSRIRRALGPAGYSVEHASRARQLAGHRRQRPFVLCFLDARGQGEGKEVSRCFRVRPAERYVLVLNPWQGVGRGTVPEGFKAFGYLREPFAAEEVLAWSRRASHENRLLQGDRSLEDLLYGRFRAFLQDLGPQGMTSLRDLVWERVEKPLIIAVLEWTGGNQTRAARILGIHRNTLRTKVRLLGINPSRPWGDRD